MSWIKSVTVNLLIAGVTFSVCLGLIEVALNFVPVTGGIVEEDGEGRSLRLKLFPANYRSSRKPDDYYLAETNGSIEQKDYLLTTDRFQSLTVRDVSDRRDLSATRNVMFLGGSTTESLFVDEEKRWPELSVALANRGANGKPFAAFNYGVSGNSLMHSTANLFAYGRIIQPEVVVVHHLINDLSLLSQDGTYVTSGRGAKDYFVTMAPESLGQHLFRQVRHNLLPNTGDLLVRLLAGYLAPARGGNAVGGGDLVFDFNTETGRQSIADAYLRQMDEFLTLTQQLGAMPVVVIQAVVTDRSAPHFGVIHKRNAARHVDIDAAAEAHQALAERLVAYAQTRGVATVDLRDLGNDTMMYDLVHYNAAGSAIVAERMAAALRGQ